MSVTTEKPQLPATSHTERAQVWTTPLIKLIVIGLITQIIYVTYIVAFPLISNTQAGGPAADLEILMRDHRWFAPIYTVGIFALFYLFWRAMDIISKLNFENPLDERTLKIFVLSFGLIFGFTLIWLYPITANDLFRYVLRGRIWAVYGESPMLTPPDAYPNDPYYAFSGEFGDWVSGYGPLWEIAVQVPLRLGAVDMVSGSVGLKIIVLLSYLACVVMLGWYAIPEKSSALAAMTFFAWNPLILMQGPGNGHNDLVFMALMVLGIVLWQRNIWWAAVLALSLSVLAKAPAAILVPPFAAEMLRREPTWKDRATKAVLAALIGVVTAYVVYSILGPVVETLTGVTDMLTTRRGFAIASGVRMIQREIIPWDVAEYMPRTTARYIFIIFYVWLIWRTWLGKLNFVTAGFLAYFAYLMLGRTFRIWYPMWLIPLAAIHLTPATFWRVLLFGLTSELSIINYFVIWRWWLREVDWSSIFPFIDPVRYYWTIMHTLTVPWLFGIPLFGPIFIRWLNQKSPDTDKNSSPLTLS